MKLIMMLVYIETFKVKLSKYLKDFSAV